MVDHSIFRAFNKGALAMLKVSGPENKAIYSGKQSDTVYLPEGNAIQSLEDPVKTIPAKHLKERIQLGQRIYEQNCAACHQPTGEGIPNAFPPLAKSDFLLKDKLRAAGIVINGRQGTIIVNDKTYVGAMPAFQLNDEQIANVLSYVMNTWGNKSEGLTPEEVAQVRAKPQAATPTE